MSFDLQTFVAGALVAVAALHLAWRSVQAFRTKRRRGCGAACGRCGASGSESQVVIQIAAPPKTDDVSSCGG